MPGDVQHPVFLAFKVTVLGSRADDALFQPAHLQLGVDEPLDFPDRRPGFLHVEHVPNMPHAVVNVDVHRYPLGLHPDGQLPGIVQQHLVAPHVDEHRRKVGEIAVQRRYIRGFQILSPRVQQGHFPQLLAGNQRIASRVAVMGVQAFGQICPGGDHHQRGGQRPPPVPQRHGQRQGQPPARRISAEHDVSRVISLVKQKVKGRHRVLQRRWKQVFRRQPVVVGEHRQTALLRQPANQRLMGGGGAGHIRPAMGVQDRLVGGFLRRYGPHPRQRAFLPGTPQLHRLILRVNIPHHFQPLALAGHGKPGQNGLDAFHGANQQLAFQTRHILTRFLSLFHSPADIDICIIAQIRP